MDNHALNRRLELVKTELQEVQGEKDKTYQRYLECVGEVEAAQKALNGDGSAEDANKILQD